MLKKPTGVSNHILFPPYCCKKTLSIFSIGNGVSGYQPPLRIHAGLTGVQLAGAPPKLNLVNRDAVLAHDAPLVLSGQGAVRELPKPCQRLLAQVTGLDEPAVMGWLLALGHGAPLTVAVPHTAVNPKSIVHLQPPQKSAAAASINLLQQSTTGALGLGLRDGGRDRRMRHQRRGAYFPRCPA